MANTVSPSGEVLSLGQIAKLIDLISAGLRKAGLPSDLSQRVIESEGDVITKEFVAGFRKRVEAKMNEVVRRVKVDRSPEPQAMLDALGRVQYVNKKIVKTMPKGEGEEVDVVFFKPDLSDKGGYISDADLAKEFESRGITPDPYAQAQVNKDDPDFVNKCPNGTHWKDGGSYNFVTFSGWGGGRCVSVHRSNGEWSDDWWFAGVRK